jgi:hypothetical protein
MDVFCHEYSYSWTISSKSDNGFGVAEPHSFFRNGRQSCASSLPNAEVSDRSQPPLRADLFLSEPAGSGSLHRLVERSRFAAWGKDGLEASHEWKRWCFASVLFPVRMANRRPANGLALRSTNNCINTIMHIKKVRPMPS